MAKNVSMVLAGLALVLGATGCKAKLDTEKGEKVILQALKDQKVEVTSLSCPRDVELKVQTTFDCTGKMADGKDYTVSVTITDADGNVKWRLSKVGDQVAPDPSKAPPPDKAEPTEKAPDKPAEPAGEDHKE